MKDSSFSVNQEGLALSIELLNKFWDSENINIDGLINTLPEEGLGEKSSLEKLAPLILGKATKLADPSFLAQMDPPTPWITWATAMWNAALNQNLLHQTISPVATEIEKIVIEWLSPFFKMSGGQMLPGSTLANISALWVARETRGIKRVVTSRQAHVSIAKAANLLGLEYLALDCDSGHHICLDKIENIDDSALVLTAGTTSVGAIDNLKSGIAPAWLHVDAAWAGPLIFSDKYRNKLDGIERADSISVSAHKLLFQPKESALVFFKDWKNAAQSMSFGGDYLAKPNVGILGSHGATAIPLYATLVAWGRSGLEQRINRCMDIATEIRNWVANNDNLLLFSEPETGVVVWKGKDTLTIDKNQLVEKGFASTVNISGELWLRNVAANPNCDIDSIVRQLLLED
jgi:L-2,4-diaminobutyrate decarboxylase